MSQNTLESQHMNFHILYQFKEIYELVSVFPSGEVHEVLGQSVAQIGTGLHRDFTVCAAEGWRILYKEKTAKSVILFLGLLSKLKNNSSTTSMPLFSSVLEKEESKTLK